MRMANPPRRTVVGGHPRMGIFKCKLQLDQGVDMVDLPMHENTATTIKAVLDEAVGSREVLE